MQLKYYAKKISLNSSFIRPKPFTGHDELELNINRVIDFFLEERNEKISVPSSLEEKSLLLRALLNQRGPGFIPKEENRLLDRVLWTERIERGIVEVDSVDELWRGDITQLGADAIVNAANSDMLGCITETPKNIAS